MTPSVEDRLALRDLVEAYARCADRVDATGLAALFVADGVLRIVPRGASEPARERIGREAIASAIAGLDRYTATFHFVGNHYVDVDGETATGEVYCIAHHVSGEPGTENDHAMFVRYEDTYRREPDGWRIAERVLRVQWTEDRAVGAP